MRLLIILLILSLHVNAQRGTVTRFSAKGTNLISVKVDNPTTTPVLTLNLNEMNFPVSNPTKSALDKKADKSSLDAINKSIKDLQSSQANANNTIKGLQDSIKVLRGLLSTQQRPVPVPVIVQKNYDVIIDSLSQRISGHSSFDTSVIAQIRQVAADVAAKEDKIPYVYLGYTFSGSGTDSLHAVEAIIPSITQDQRLSLTDPNIRLVYQIDQVEGLYVRKKEGWVFVK